MDSPDIKTADLSRATLDFLSKALWIRYDSERREIERWERQAKQTNTSLSKDAMRDMVRHYQAVRIEWQQLESWLTRGNRVTHKTDHGHTPRNPQTA